MSERAGIDAAERLHRSDLEAIDRRSFLARFSAVLAAVGAWIVGFPAPAAAAERCFYNYAYVTCQWCHGNCGSGCSGVGTMGWRRYINISGSEQCCTDHGWNGCVGAYACTGWEKGWFTYVGLNTCCGC